MNPPIDDAALLRGLPVLFVEDDPFIREEMAGFLRRRVGSLDVATDGGAGLRAFEARPVPLVITDIRLPGMDGLEMAGRIRRIRPETQVVVITAFDEGAYLDRALALDVDHFVPKPVRAASLEFALRACARRLEEPAGAEPPAPGDRVALAQLTPREREVLGLVGRGLTAREAGLSLGISQATVQTHLVRVKTKLGLHRSSALAAFAVRSGLA